MNEWNHKKKLNCCSNINEKYIPFNRCIVLNEIKINWIIIIVINWV